jgi:CTP:molybdopterin cytidylyltransferase MocA
VEDVAAILLAAGRSRRMGKFKPLLPFGDTTVIQSCLDNLRAAGIEEIVIVVGHRADDIRTHLHDSRLAFAFNPDPNSEMSASIVRGLGLVDRNAPAFLIALVDHPAVDAGTIRAIIESWKRGAKLVQPEHAGRGGHPVLIDASFRRDLLDLDPNAGLRSFFEAHRQDVLRLAVESPYVARDMDTWEDYLRLHEDLFGRPPDAGRTNFP